MRVKPAVSSNPRLPEIAIPARRPYDQAGRGINNGILTAENSFWRFIMLNRCKFYKMGMKPTL
jgi:hypothetical protein